VPFEFIERVWETMCQTRLNHTFQILTKRPWRMHQFVSEFNTNALGGITPKGIWLGVTAEDQQRADERIPLLLQTPAAVRFVSVEPMLGPVDLIGAGGILNGAYPGLNWVIIGCESGPNRRPMKLEWALDLVRQCQVTQVPVFVKQIEMYGKVSHHIPEWPERLQVREYPRP